MNKLRRKQLEQISSKIDEIKSELESVLIDEEEYRDGMPENLQSSERYDKSESACYSLEIAVDQLDEAINEIDSAIQC